VAIAAEIGDAPVAGRLLDVDLVIFRTGAGIAVGRDLCPHRHVRLTAGKVEQGVLVCFFHGLAFDGSGQCVRVPALGRDARLPKSYRMRMFRSEVRYGLVWCCLYAESTQAIPEYPEADAALDASKLHLAQREWPVSAPRQIENFIDLAHLPIIHPESLSTLPDAPVRPAEVEETNDGVVLRAPLLQRQKDGPPRWTDMEYRIAAPFNMDFRASDAETHVRFFHLYNLAAPVTAYQCRVFSLTVMDEANARSRMSELNASDEDIDALSKLAVADMPLNQKHEVHLPVDNVSLAYRRTLQRLGLGRH
jgi:vanillate O-demethylase monooxygenase subunit